MDGTKLVKEIIKAQKEVEEELKRKRREETEKRRREPRFEKIGEVLYETLSDEDKQIIDEFGDVIEEIVYARYKPPYEKYIKGPLVRTTIKEAPRRIRKIISNAISIECYTGSEMMVSYFGVTYGVKYVKHKENLYVEFKDPLITGICIATLLNDEQRLYDMLIRKIEKDIGFKVADYDIVGYEDIERRIHNILTCTDPRVGNRHICLAGPPGCGKTSIVKKIVKMHQEYVAIGITMDIEWDKWITTLANTLRRSKRKILLVIDEIDEFGLTREVDREKVYELLRLLDGVEDLRNIKVIATTNRLNDLDPALLRPGRLGPVLLVKEPTTEQRKKIFEYYCKKFKVKLDFDKAIGNLKCTGCEIRQAFEDCIIDQQKITEEKIKEVLKKNKQIETFYR